jgi:phospholipid/cholesterol/gamma-HCH transport system substrate-binding protein
MASSSSRHLVLGLFFVAVLLVLGYYTLFLTDFKLFGETHERTVQFSEANGLRRGDTVLVAGIRQGRVKDLAFDPAAPVERRVTVTLLLDQDLALRDGFTIQIEDATLLGGKQISVDPGPASGAPIGSSMNLVGTVATNALAGLNDLVTENEGNLTKMIADAQLAVADVRDLVANVRAGQGAMGLLFADENTRSSLERSVQRFETTVDNAAGISEDLRNGEGLIARLIRDPQLATKADEILDRVRAITDDLAAVTKSVREGDGIVARAINDPQIAQDAAEAIASVRDIAQRIQKGEGVLGGLITDSQLLDDLTAIFAGVRAGDGTIGRLFSEDQIYTKLDLMLDDLTVASAAIRNGKGTLGKLIMDSGIADEIERALGIVTRSLEEYREAAPISVLTSVFFSAF